MTKIEKDKQLQEIRRYLRITRIKRSFTARILSVLITTLVGWAITGNPFVGFTIGLADLSIKIFTYYFHESVWESKMTKDIRKIKAQ